MIALLLKELRGYFTGIVGYLSIAIFLLLSGLFLFVFESEFNLIDFGFADLTPFFLLVPWLFIFLIPAITMRSFTIERNLGTLEMLVTRPISFRKIVASKYGAALILILVALIPTLIYVYTISILGETPYNLDYGVTVGSYIGALLLAAAYTAIGIFASSITSNQIVSFLIAAVLCFTMYYGFEGIASYMTGSDFIPALGIKYHYESMARGVVDTRNIIYFLCVILFFFALSESMLHKIIRNTTILQSLKKPIVVTAGIIILSLVSSKIHKRLDLTQDSRYTLSPAAKDLITQADGVISIDVFLDGELPGEFRKLRQETRQFIEEMVALNPNIKYEFLNPLEDASEEESGQIVQNLMQYGIQPAVASINKGGKSTNVTVFPYALITLNEKTVAVQLLKNVARATQEERVNSSIQQLEYQFADALRRLTTNKEDSKTIAILKDSGELPDIEIADFIKTLQQYYRVAPFGIEFVTKTDSVNPVNVLNALKEYDLVIEPKPTILLSETKKYILDQYIMQGGKMIIAADPIIMENDSLANPQSKAYALPRDIGMDEMLFRYGLRLNNGLVKDLRAGPLALATGEGRNTQYEAFDWFYYPISKSTENNPITKNVEEVKFEYTGTIDTLKNGIKKTILLKTSPQTQLVPLPAVVTLAELQDEPDLTAYNAGEKPLAVLAEGRFTSAYKNRVKPFLYKNDMETGTPSAILLLADGDIIKNQVDRGRPVDLGYDLRSGANFGNKEFIMNSVNYLLEDTGLINLRNKNIVIPFLDVKRAYDKKFLWQLLNVALPVFLIVLLGVFYNHLRKNKYSKHHRPA